jgi:hypothetical protein
MQRFFLASMKCSEHPSESTSRLEKNDPAILHLCGYLGYTDDPGSDVSVSNLKSACLDKNRCFDTHAANSGS